MSPNEVELKACPFCGGGDIREQETHHGRNGLYCANCRASADPDFWNTRTPPPLNADREEIARIIDPRALWDEEPDCTTGAFIKRQAVAYSKADAILSHRQSVPTGAVEARELSEFEINLIGKDVADGSGWKSTSQNHTRIWLAANVGARRAVAALIKDNQP